ncbi:uncharacterized protein BDW43DRAFT_182613 [Aspergillus alliaceus]|uniref:uncharacterized protein n=1 Tax=Petromyces alliaceus TaxID=209559 RepID=UPI0012A432B2|nr:uncharacterized protein BDW43DRAFT_182613 [Aspergillus alliaceus]KAB8237756.1 hypothetical protein BDW43DRAFT_182613 [Aspergillus alliaceus]
MSLQIWKQKSLRNNVLVSSILVFTRRMITRVRQAVLCFFLTTMPIEADTILSLLSFPNMGRDLRASDPLDGSGMYRSVYSAGIPILDYTYCITSLHK